MSKCVKDGSGALVGGKAMILKFCEKSHRNCSSETTDSRSGYAVFGHCFATGVGRCGKRVRPLIPRVLSCRKARMTIHLDLTLPSGSSSLPEGIGRAALKRLLLGLAPDEACHAANCHQRPGGLLHRRFTLTHRPKPVRRSILCCAISQVALGGRYPPSCSMEPGSSSTDKIGRGHQEVSNAP